MLRAVRFAAQLGFAIEERTEQAIRDMCGNLEKISAERIQVELVKLVTSDHPEEMQNVYDTGIAAVILPEFCTMMETEQHNPHHIYTVGEHTIRSMQYIRADKVPVSYTHLENDLKAILFEKSNTTGGAANMGMGPLGIGTK